MVLFLIFMNISLGNAFKQNALSVVKNNEKQVELEVFIFKQ